jgi:hypothetical protein
MSQTLPNLRGRSKSSDSRRPQSAGDVILLSTPSKVANKSNEFENLNDPDVNQGDWVENDLEPEQDVEQNNNPKFVAAEDHERDATDDDNLFYQPVPALSTSKGNLEKSQKKKQNKLQNRSRQPSSTFKPPTPKSDEFRREYSKDHPLAGGKGKYDTERAGGEKHPVGWIDSSNEKQNSKSSSKYDHIVIHQAANKSSNSSKDVAAWQNEIDSMRRQQNQALLELLEEERLAEEDRGKMGKLVKDHEERHRYVLN